jgi:hypothetical protein
MRRWLFTLGLVALIATPSAAQNTPFTDDPLVQRVTVVKAIHVEELRTRINARRAATGVAVFGFTDPSLSVGVTTVRAVHLTEMRTAISDVYTALGRAVPNFTDPVITPQSTVIKAVHIAELRAAVIDLEGQYRARVNLGAAGGFAILTKAGITNTPSSAVVGDVGTSPITGASILLTCSEVTGTIYSVDAAGPPCRVTNATHLEAAVGDMQLAYTDAAGRVTPDFTDLGAGEIGGLTLAPGLYKWNGNVSVATDVTLLGGPNAIWIFQVSGTVTQASATRINLAGGALAKNIFWQVAQTVTIGTNAHFAGIVLGQTNISVTTGASVSGRLFAQTAVTLQMNAVTQPAP